MTRDALATACVILIFFMMGGIIIYMDDRFDKVDYEIKRVCSGEAAQK